MSASPLMHVLLITSNPAASIHLKVKLVADHAHAKIAETISVGAYLTGTIISWKLVLARYVSASLIAKDLNQGSL